MITKPDYCPELRDDEDCSVCGATVAGDDPVNGVCQARFRGSAPAPLVEIILVHKDTGKPI